MGVTVMVNVNLKCDCQEKVKSSVWLLQETSGKIVHFACLAPTLKVKIFVEVRDIAIGSDGSRCVTTIWLW